jgi:hypothetical protein
MASTFKRIRFFESDQIDTKSEPKAAAPSDQVVSIQDVNVIHMIQLDMFFLFLGTPVAPAPGTIPKEHFYVTKNLMVRE